MDSSNVKPVKKRKETTQERCFMWNEFYSNNKFGIIVECTKCKKWRKILDYSEPHEVPNDWNCSMSSKNVEDKSLSCDDPEEEFNESYFEYYPGSVVWAKLDGYPWWPGMVDEDPDLEEYYWMDSKGTEFYHVTFLDERVTRSWVTSSNICSFLKPPKRNFLYFKKYHDVVHQAEERGKSAMKMSIKERLQKYSFVNLFKGKWSLAANYDDIEDKEDLNLTDILLQEIDEISSLDSFDLLDDAEFDNFVNLQEHAVTSTQKEKTIGNIKSNKVSKKVPITIDKGEKSFPVNFVGEGKFKKAKNTNKQTKSDFVLLRKSKPLDKNIKNKTLDRKIMKTNKSTFNSETIPFLPVKDIGNAEHIVPNMDKNIKDCIEEKDMAFESEELFSSSTLVTESSKIVQKDTNINVESSKSDIEFIENEISAFDKSLNIAPNTCVVPNFANKFNTGNDIADTFMESQTIQTKDGNKNSFNIPKTYNGLKENQKGQVINAKKELKNVKSNKNSDILIKSDADKMSKKNFPKKKTANKINSKNKIKDETDVPLNEMSINNKNQNVLKSVIKSKTKNANTLKNVGKCTSDKDKVVSNKQMESMTSLPSEDPGSNKTFKGIRLGNPNKVNLKMKPVFKQPLKINTELIQNKNDYEKGDCTKKDLLEQDEKNMKNNSPILSEKESVDNEENQALPAESNVDNNEFFDVFISDDETEDVD